MSSAPSDRPPGRHSPPPTPAARPPTGSISSAQVEGWIDAAVERVYAILDNLNVHSATDVLLFALAHPRWEFVFQPKYAAYLNLIEPWWKILRSLALKGRRFETWHEIEEAVRRATAYWNAHKHPFLWGRRRRHRTARRSGIAVLPNATTT